MNDKQLQKAKQIEEKIKVCKENISKASDMCSFFTKPKESKLMYHDIVTPLIIPPTLFQDIGNMVLSEYKKRLVKLEKELNEL